MKEILLYQDIKEEGRKEGVEEGLEQGLKQGLKQGHKQGEECFALLSEKLLNSNRIEDLKKATTDISFRKKLYDEFSIS